MIGIVLTVGFLLLLVGLVVTVCVVDTLRFRRAVTRLAERCQGLNTRRRFGEHSIRFQWGHLPVEVLVTASQRAFVEVRIPWGDCRFHCEIRPTDLLERISQFFNGPDVEIGSRWFDDQYVIRTNDSGELRQLLSPETQLYIETLRVGDSLATVHVAVSRGWLVVKRPLQDLELLEALVRLMLRLYSVATRGRQGSQGITFINQGRAHLRPAKGNCRVCGESLRVGPEQRQREQRHVVCCARCKSPHHRECWEYCGGCSTYGCGETTCMTPGAPQVRRAG